MASNTSESKTICYRLNFKSSDYSKDLIEYLQQQSYCLRASQRVEQIVETSLLPLVLSPEDPNFRRITVECLAKLKSQIEIIQAITGISLSGTPQSDALLQTLESEVVEQQNRFPTDLDHDSAILTPTKKLEATIDDFRQQLKEGVDPLVISQTLVNIQPESQESWTEEMWQLYDSFYEEVSQLQYETTFSSQAV